MDLIIVYAFIVTIAALAKISNLTGRYNITKNALDNSRRRAVDRAEEVVRLSNIITYNNKIIGQLTSEVQDVFDEVFYDRKNDTIMLYDDLVYLGQL